MERNKTMLTLIPVRGKENELKKMLNVYINTHEMLGAEIIKGETRTIHYHVIGEDIDPIIKGMKEWPGIRIKVHKISESQAQEMKLRHVPYCYFLDEGLQHEGDSVSKEKVFYLCDGEVEKCKKTRCYKNGGDCNYTTNISHAKNFHKTDAPYPVFCENEAVPGEPDTAMVIEH